MQKKAKYILKKKTMGERLSQLEKDIADLDLQVNKALLSATTDEEKIKELVEICQNSFNIIKTQNNIISELV